MVTKSKNVGAAKKSRLKVGKLKLNKERVKDLSGGQKRGVNMPFFAYLRNLQCLTRKRLPMIIFTIR